MELRVASATDRGKVRNKNEDSVLTDAPLVAVADGMGGHKAGEVASHMALEVLSEWKDRLGGSSGDKAASILRQALGEANKTIWEKGQQDEDKAGMGTTLTAGWINKNAIALAHVGDTRAYLLRDGTLQQLTHDQNVAQDLVRRGRISEAEAASSPQRHVLLQALGADPAGLDIEVASVELRPGDRLLLATDGLHGMVKEPERIRDILLEHSDPDEASRVLVEAANAAGGEDNITVVVIDTITTDEPQAQTAEPEPDERVERPTPPGAEPERSSSLRRALIIGALALIAVAAAIFFVTRISSDILLVAERGGSVVLMRGQPGTSGEPASGDVVRVFTDERLDRFPRTVRQDLRSGIAVDSTSEANRVVENLPRLLGPQDTPTPSPSPTPTGSASPATDAALPLPSPAP